LVYFPPFWYVAPRKIWQPWYNHSLTFHCIQIEGHRWRGEHVYLGKKSSYRTVHVHASLAALV
jgi:hypothetical protein